jgi:hypothetical protein
MDSFGLTRQRGRFVAQEMVEASLPKALQGGLDGRAGIESDRPRLNRLWHIGDSEEPIASPGLPPRLGSNLDDLWEPSAKSYSAAGVAAFELELDLADWLDATAISHASKDDATLKPLPSRPPASTERRANEH